MTSIQSPSAQAAAGRPAEPPPRTEGDWALQLIRGGHRVVRTVGTALPQALIQACGLTGVALDVALSPGGTGISVRRRPHAADVLRALGDSDLTPLLVRTDDATGAAVFSALREHMRRGDLPQRAVFGLDLPGGEGEAAQAFRRRQLGRLAAWAQSLGGSRPDDAALHAALAREHTRQQALDRLESRRIAGPGALRGGPWAGALLASLVLPLDDHLAQLTALGKEADARLAAPGPRTYLAGAHRATPEDFDTLDALGLQVVGDDLYTPTEGEPPILQGDPWSLVRLGPLPGPCANPIERARLTVRRALMRRASQVVHVSPAGDEREPWFRRWLRLECQQVGLAFIAFEQLGGQDAAPTDPSSPAPMPPAEPTVRPAAASATPAQGDEGRSRKSLDLIASFSHYQREWFQSIRARAESGEPFVVVNADAPQELLRAFGLPFVVNQWWASIVAAKQQSARYLALLSERGYPTDAEAYSAQGLAALFDDDAAQAPWGGLPRPGLLMAVNGTAATEGIYRSWAAQAGARLVLLDRTAETRMALFEDWWDRLPSDWERALDADRLDLLERQFAAAIDTLQSFCGRGFDEAKFLDVMALVNRQEEFYRQTRDLIARADRAPVGVVDTMPAVMVPQWHRGTLWGVQAAQALHDAVRARVEAGQAACDGERLRLMWVGRGLWSQMGFYQQWERSHGAVFVWSMYLGLAADGYLRYFGPGQSPLRALASRFVTMGDELRMPTWAGAWHVKEARLHRVDAAIAVDDADPMVLSALERNGIPVLRLNLGNFGASHDSLRLAQAQVAPFLDSLAPARRA